MRIRKKVSVSCLIFSIEGGKKEKWILKYSDEFLILYFQAMVEGISKPEIYAKLLPYTAEWTEVLIKGIAPKKK